MYSWIEGTPVEGVRDEDVVQALQFVEKLYQLRKVKSARNLPKAAEACLCLEDLQNQIIQRNKRLLFRLLMHQDFENF